MWKVTIPSPYGGEPSLYWVAADTAAEAETTARHQAGDQITAQTPVRVEHADTVDPAGELWPRPRLVDGIRVFTFDDSRTAYDQTQVRDDLHGGDVLHIPSENVAGFLMRAWPVAVSPDRGALHALADPDEFVIDGIDYHPSARVAQTLLDPPETPSPPAARPPLTRGLRQAAGAWTVTIAGSERHDGEGPYIWVVDAPAATTAAAVAERHHQSSQEDTDTVVRSVEAGAPTADYPWAYNDLRGIPSRTVVLAPEHIRQLARIHLACKRRDRFLDSLDIPGYIFTDAETDHLIDMNEHIVTLVRQLIDEFEPTPDPQR